MALAARFLLVFAPQVVLYGIGIVLTGVLQAHRRFAGPAIAPLLSSVVVVGAYLLFAAIGGSSDVEDLTTPAELVLSVGTTLGVVVLSLSLLVPLRGLRLGLRPALRFPVGAAPRVRRLALAGVLTLAGQQLVAVVAIRLANDGTPDGTQVVYAAGLTLFLVPWAALAVPLATSAYPGLSERADLRRRGGLPRCPGTGGRLHRRDRGGRRRAARGRRRADGPGVPRQRLRRGGRRAAGHDHRFRARPRSATAWSPC